MNYDIRIKGFKDLLRVDDAEPLKSRWESFIKKTSTDQVVSAGDWTGKLSDITAFRRAPTLRSENNLSEEIDLEYRRELMRQRGLSAQGKATLLGLFRLLFWGFTKKKSEDRPEIEKTAMDIQEKFFMENPKRTMCDPILFRPMFARVANACDPSVLRILERVVRQDRFAEKNI